MCISWYIQYLLNTFSLISVAGIIVGINSGELLLFQWVSQFARNQFITSKLQFSLTKMFLIQYFNMALITILMYFNIEEIDLPIDFPILKGKYKKFNVEWYKIVGSTIIVTMIL